MAVDPRDIPITRDQVYTWIEEYNGAQRGLKKAKKRAKLAVGAGVTVEDYIRAQVDALQLPDPFVNTSGHDQLPDQVPIADFILMDLTSYPNYNGTGS